MPITLYEQTPGQLVASGERTVATYESGLVRVDQTYICASTNAATHRATLAVGASMPDGDIAPTIDGLYIYPAPQEIKRPDGLTEFRVSAYGRASTAFQNYQQSVVSYKTTQSVTNLVRYSLYQITGSICIKRGESTSADDLALDPSLTDPFGYFLSNLSYSIVSTVTTVAGSSNYTNWDGASVPNITYIVAITYDNGVTNVIENMNYSSPRITVDSMRNFGEFTELDITVTIPTDGANLANPIQFV